MINTYTKHVNLPFCSILFQKTKLFIWKNKHKAVQLWDPETSPGLSQKAAQRKAGKKGQKQANQHGLCKDPKWTPNFVAV